MKYSETLVDYILKCYENKGVLGVVSEGLGYCGRIFYRTFFKYLHYQYYRYFRNGNFNFGGRPYEYFYRYYNRTWTNERCVEVPIIWDKVTEHEPSTVLEFGNVLSHYFDVDHDILDLYENSSEVINEDVVKFNSDKKYELIVSISTIEHVGWDEQPKNPGKAISGYQNLKQHLATDGTLILTVPLGYNPSLEQYIYDGEINFTDVLFLKKDGHEWKEVKKSEAAGTDYTGTFPFNGANAILIGILEN